MKILKIFIRADCQKNLDILMKMGVIVKVKIIEYLYFWN